MSSGAFRVAPEEVTAAAGQIEQYTQEVEQMIGQMMRIATNLSNTWTGTANSAFEGAMTDWQTAANKISEASREIATATKTAGSNYSDAETTNTSMFH